MTDASVSAATIEACLDGVDTLVNPTYTTPSPKEGAGSGKSPARSGLANRTARRSDFPQGGGNQFSRQGGFPFAQDGQMSLDGSSQASLGNYGFPQGTTQSGPQPWRQGSTERQVPRSLARTSRSRAKNGKFTTTPKKDTAQGPSSSTPPSPTLQHQEVGRVEDLPLSPPHSPVYSDGGEDDTKGQDEATESDSGVPRTAPVVCCVHTPHHPTHPEPTSSSHAVMRAQGMVSSTSTPTTFTRNFDTIIID